MSIAEKIEDTKSKIWTCLDEITAIQHNLRDLYVPANVCSHLEQCLKETEVGVIIISILIPEDGCQAETALVFRCHFELLAVAIKTNQSINVTGRLSVVTPRSKRHLPEVSSKEKESLNVI
jgi:hypothetical protein